MKRCIKMLGNGERCSNEAVPFGCYCEIHAPVKIGSSRQYMPESKKLKHAVKGWKRFDSMISSMRKAKKTGGKAS